MKVLVCGGGGFIGGHLAKKLKEMNHEVICVDLKENEFSKSIPDKMIIGDLTNQKVIDEIFSDEYDEIYQLAADMGGAGYIFTGDNDASVMYNSATINLNILNALKKNKKTKIFYSSSACIYPEYNQLILKTLNVKKALLILQLQIVNMDGKNYLVKDCI